MAKKHLLWQLYYSYLIITILALVLVSWYASRSLRGFYYKEVADGLEARTQLAGRQILDVLSEQKFDEIDRLCKTVGRTAGMRLTVILPNGQVIGDSDEQPGRMENHADRPEFIRAMENRTGESIRFSDTLGKNMMYVALALSEKDAVVAVVRGSLPVTAIDRAMSDIYAKIVWAAVFVAVLVAGITFLVSRKITLPIKQMKEAAKEFAAGRFDSRAPVPDSAELAELAVSLNETAARLKQTIETITSQRNRLEAVLASMAEGVIAVDSEGHVVSVNKAAAGLLGIDAGSAVGRSIEEVVRNIDIQRFLQQILESTTPIEADIVLSSELPVDLHLQGTRLSEQQPEGGAVLVLSDMTRMRRLENIRRDFVANVSHELRTPITSIKGFVETLLDGAISEPKQAQRFLKIIEGHTSRLMAIIEDLLSLSRLEENGQTRMMLERVKVKPLLESAIELSQPKAEDKQIKITLVCGDDIDAPMNPTLVEQAVFNLVDNAIKYSASESPVQLNVEKDDKEIKIAVKDFGCGIDKPHLGRVFERFYVVDKARSRKLGGTGLGLSIVKHIAQLHGGSVTVESTSSQGSIFTLHLPVK